ncbi:unnamed protein product [Danaus chrysippus]|uniref:(African queen) hypothetical protein n=1 Tax=Danaus chrysippus TaxID=151541 RepID=A0A8J2WEP7_9NEOP|nr:unnamed protein product [Danaus chrysippus]
MCGKCIVFISLIVSAIAIYPYFDTQDFIYNVPKVFRISITLDRLLEYYEKTPSKDPEWYIALGIARGQLEYTVNELDKSVPLKLKENLQNITRRMDRIRNSTDYTTLVYRSKDYEYVAKATFENLEVLSSILEPLTIGTMGTQKPYRFTFEQYVQEAKTKMPTRKAADACMMQLLISAMESQTTQSDGACELAPELFICASQGYGEFIKPRWMNKVISWQEPKGCYADDRQPFLKLTGFVGPTASPPPKDREEEYRVKKAASSDGGTCNSLTSAMALGTLVVYVRALLETDQAFQYDVLV